MGVRTVAKRNPLDGADEFLRSAVRRRVLLPEVPADGVVVPGGHLECLQRELAPERLADVAVALRPRLEELCVVRGVGQHGHAGVVLGGGAEQRDTANVDLLDRIGERAAGLGDSLGERVQVAYNDGDGRDGLGLEILLIGGDRASQDTLETRVQYQYIHLLLVKAFSPPCTAGCRVFTLPPSISGALVMSETSLSPSRLISASSCESAGYDVLNGNAGFPDFLRGPSRT